MIIENRLMFLMNISKAFNTVPHAQQAKKQVGIVGNIPANRFYPF